MSPIKSLGGINFMERNIEFDSKREMSWQWWSLPFLFLVVEMTTQSQLERERAILCRINNIVT